MILAADQFGPTFDSSPLHPTGPVDEHIQTVYTAIFWSSLVLFVFVAMLIIVGALRFRRRSDDEEPAQVHGNNRLEVAWTVIPFAILFSLFILTAVNMKFITQAPAGAMKVCVLGQRFTWSYYYNTSCGTAVQVKGGEGGETKLGYRDIIGKRSSTASDQILHVPILVIPVGRPVALEVVSADVIHSFYIPTLGGQINAFPNQFNHMWLQADHVGKFYGQCTELCGEGHAIMEIVVQAVPANQFQAFLDKMDNSQANAGAGAGGQ